ncbi:serine/threonine-protein kinase [Mycobacterium sp. shizuoka-1]|uniref:serine/threonine-protein kinase n=1 Tax=Mycobacterium sp. shizuoka-1 TaxID=2039281 RepID=UPI000C05E5F4|nr:serine/threonine-protein kinase [Mycobacterium sp. shizuoka-1]GAY15244.1 hypothetical protein MSZK_19700 [Mycobacterium sp. shizuoka-1]
MTGHELLVDRYELRGLLGRGGMADVRDGWDTRLNRPVAVKLLHPALGAVPDFRRRFEDEARSAARLAHQNIVVVFDFGVHDGSPFIVLERLPGRTLADLIAAGPLPARLVRAMLDDVLAGLQAAHSAGILHRDIKPGNILLTAPGDSMKVADFGIAKSGSGPVTMTGQIVGTMSYLSPERIAGAAASVSDDLYAVGVMAYEALLGKRLFPQDNPAALTRAIMDTPPPPVAVARTDVDPILATVIDRAMARNPLQRFGSAAQMRAALAGDRRALLDGPATAAVVPAPAVPVRPSTKVLPATQIAFGPDAVAPPRRRRGGAGWWYAAAVAVLVVLAVSVVASATDPAPSSPPPQPVGTSTPAVTPTSGMPPPGPTAEPPAPPAPNPPGGPRGRGHGKNDGKRP